MKYIERLANDAREKWLGSKEQESNYFINEFNAGYVAGYEQAKEDAICNLEDCIKDIDFQGNHEFEGESSWGFDTLSNDKWIKVP